MKNIDYISYLLVKYYIFCGLFQLVWSLAVIGFVIFLILTFHSYWYLFFVLLIAVKPYRMLKNVKIKDFSDES